MKQWNGRACAVGVLVQGMLLLLLTFWVMSTCYTCIMIEFYFYFLWNFFLFFSFTDVAVIVPGIQLKLCAPIRAYR